MREFVYVAIRRRVNILCVQKTKWKGQKAKEVEGTGFKLWYTGETSGRNGVGILIDRSLKDGFVDVRSSVFKASPRRCLGIHAPSTDLRLARLGVRLARLGVQPPHLARHPPYRLENRG